MELDGVRTLEPQSERQILIVHRMMNNSWYTVRPEIQEDQENGFPALLFRHPCEPGTGTGGWMQPSIESRVEDIKHEASSPQKQFTRQEIEKHNKDNDCWIVVNGKVYDATSVLSWHPGGKAPIMAHAGKVHADTTDEFESIHDDYALKRLNGTSTTFCCLGCPGTDRKTECVLGVITEKAKGLIKRQVEDLAKDKARSAQKDPETVLDHHRWTAVRLLRKSQISQDTRLYTFSLPSGKKNLGLATCQHVQFGFHFSDRLVVRSYTPTRPVLEKDEDGTFDLVVKTYFADNMQPGGTMSNILDTMRPGQEIEVKGPTGEIRYMGHGKFMIDDTEFHFHHVSLVLGGSGITPGYQLIARVLNAKLEGRGEDNTKIRVIDANKTESDILMRKELDQFAKDHPAQFQITYVLSHPGEGWTGEKGHVTKEHLEQYIFGPEEGNVALLCGPPTMIQKAVLPSLREIGYKEDQNLFGF